MRIQVRAAVGKRPTGKWSVTHGTGTVDLESGKAKWVIHDNGYSEYEGPLKSFDEDFGYVTACIGPYGSFESLAEYKRSENVWHLQWESEVQNLVALVGANKRAVSKILAILFKEWR